MNITLETIAKMCHEANRSWCAMMGDNSQVAWEDAPQWQKDSAMMGVELHYFNPKASPSASHESWMRQKVADGWVYGEVKDPEAKTHPCMVDFEDLPPEQQVKDHIFRNIVHAMAPFVDPETLFYTQVPVQEHIEQKRILHVTIDTDTWTPTEEEFLQLEETFKNALVDPNNPVVVTHTGVSAKVINLNGTEKQIDVVVEAPVESE